MDDKLPPEAIPFRLKRREPEDQMIDLWARLAKAELKIEQICGRLQELEEKVADQQNDIATIAIGGLI